MPGEAENIKIRRLHEGEQIPYELLMLADPSKEAVDKYVRSIDIYVAELDGRIIGAYGLHTNTPEIVEIKNIAVDDAYQNKGIGKLLIRHAVQTAGKNGFKSIIIATANSSIWQLYLYQREGFEIMDMIKDYFTDNYPEPIYENGILCKHLLILSRLL